MGSKTIEDYGTKKNKAKFNDDGDNKIRKAIMEKKLKPFGNYYDMVYICGRYFPLRVGKEIANLRWEQFKFGTYEKGPYTGKSYVCLPHDNSKTYNKFIIDTILKTKNELSYYMYVTILTILLIQLSSSQYFDLTALQNRRNYFCREQGENLKFKYI